MGIKEKEQELAELDVDNEIAGKRAEIAEKKKLEREMKKKYGPDWRKILGIVRGIKPNKEVIEDLYIASGSTDRMRDMSRPDKVRIGGDSGD